MKACGAENILKSKKRSLKLQAAILILFISMLACSLPTATSPDVFYVRIGGNDSNDCRSVANACRTISLTVGRATVGSTIDIGPGAFVDPYEILLDRRLVLRGAGQAVTILSSATVNWLVNVQAAEVRLQDLSISGTNSPRAVGGIQIYRVSNVVLERVTVRDHTGDGAFLFDGVLTVIACTFQGNGRSLVNTGGFLQVSGSTFRANIRMPGYGTALYNTGTTSVTDTTFTENAGDTILNIAANARGVRDRSHGVLTVTGSRIISNTGVGLKNIYGRVTISQTSISDNGAAGLISQDGVLALQNSLVARNRGRGVDIEDYEEVLGSVATITQTAMVMNSGSALYLGNGTARLTNVTLSGNAAGIRIVRGNLTLAYSTIASNTLWGMQLDNADAGAEIQNSIVALNASGSDCVSNVAGQITLDSASLACDVTLTNARLRLGPLTADASTQLHPLQNGSPAIDRAAGACPGVDQRGYARPYDGNGDGRNACDVGAYEFGAGLHLEAGTPGIIELLPTETTTPSISPTPGTIILLLDRNANCRHGPGSVYPVLTSVLAGQAVQLTGRNAQNTWWLGIIPGDYKCWIASGSGQPDGDPGSLPVLPDPPTPVPTAEPGTDGTDFDKDGYSSDKDCDDKNAKIHLGAPETPDDKVDSNCNGSDDD